MVIEDITVGQGSAGEQDLSLNDATTSSQPATYQSASPRRQQPERGSTDRSSNLTVSSSTSDPSLQSSVAVTNQEASPPTERPVERKSYSLARRTRSRAADLGSKQASMEESAAGGSTPSAGSGAGKSWTAGGDGPNQAGGGVTELDQDVARLNLAGQGWNQNQTSYMRSEMRGERTRCLLELVFYHTCLCVK